MGGNLGGEKTLHQLYYSLCECLDWIVGPLVKGP